MDANVLREKILFESEISLNLPHCFSFVICVAQNGEYWRISAIWEVSQCTRATIGIIERQGWKLCVCSN